VVPCRCGEECAALMLNFFLPLLACINEVPLSTCGLWRFAESFLKLQHSAAPALSNSDSGRESQIQRTHRIA
jgi:hypothetical protein